MEQLLKDIEKAYENYCEKELQLINAKIKGTTYDLLYTTITKKDNGEEYDLQVSYDIKTYESILKLSNDRETFIYKVRQPLSEFLKELEYISWEDYYHWACETLSLNLGLEDKFEF